MKNARLDETQAGIKIAGRNINNLRYADDTTLMAESEELKSLLMKVKVESEKDKLIYPSLLGINYFPFFSSEGEELFLLVKIPFLFI